MVIASTLRDEYEINIRIGMTLWSQQTLYEFNLINEISENIN